MRKYIQFERITFAQRRELQRGINSATGNKGETLQGNVSTEYQRHNLSSLRGCQNSRARRASQIPAAISKSTASAMASGGGGGAGDDDGAVAG